MNIQEAIEIFEAHAESAKTTADFCEKTGRADALYYKKNVESYKMAIAALKKQEPMEVAEIHCDEYYCPSCGSENMADCYKVGDNYCPRCGQALKAEKENEDSD